MTYGEFCEIKRTLCILYDASETSGIRSPKRNRDVGGAKKSTHQPEFGFGSDLVPDDLANLRPMASTAEKLGVWALVEPDHLHIGFRTRR